MYLPMQITKFERGKNLIEGKKVIALGIQGTPGDSFAINTENNWITLGKTGIYELDLTNGIGLITSLIFKPLPSKVSQGTETESTPTDTEVETNETYSIPLIDILYLKDQGGAE